MKKVWASLTSIATFMFVLYMVYDIRLAVSASSLGNAFGF